MNEFGIPNLRTSRVPASVQDELHERARFAREPRFGILVTLASRSPGSTRLTFHKAAELPWNRNRRAGTPRLPGARIR